MDEEDETTNASKGFKSEQAGLGIWDSTVKATASRTQSTSRDEAKLPHDMDSKITAKRRKKSAGDEAADWDLEPRSIEEMIAKPLKRHQENDDDYQKRDK